MSVSRDTELVMVREADLDGRRRSGNNRRSVGIGVKEGRPIGYQIRYKRNSFTSY